MAVVFLVGEINGLNQADDFVRPGDHLVDVLQQIVTVFDAQGFVHAAGDRSRAVDALAADAADDLLAEFAQLHAFQARFGKARIAQHTDDIAVGGVILEAEQQIGRGQVKEMQGVGLQSLAQMHQPAQLLGRRGELVHADQLVHGLGGGEVVAHRADAAQALHQHRQLPVRTALDETLEAPEFDDVQAGLLDAVVFVQQQADLAVAFHPGHRVDDDALEVFGMGGGFQMFVHFASPVLRNGTESVDPIIHHPAGGGMAAPRPRMKSLAVDNLAIEYDIRSAFFP